MSTKQKTKHVMTPARQAALKKAVAAAKERAANKTTESKAVTRNVDKAALQKAITDREKPKAEVKTSARYHIWDVYGVKYLMDDNRVPTRRVAFIEVTSDHDTANEPEVRNKLIQDAERQLIKDGYFMTDVDAMESALMNAERVVDDIRHDIEYNGVCQHCASVNLEEFVNFLKYLRGWRDRRFELAHDLGGCCNLPPVIPNDYLENWHIQGTNLVPNNPKPKVIKSVQINAPSGDFSLADLPKEIAEPVKKAIATILPQLPKELQEKATKQLPVAKK